MDPTDRAKRSAQVVELLHQLPELSRPAGQDGTGNLATYRALHEELDLGEAVHEWRRRNWTLHLPRIAADGPSPGARTMDFVVWDPHDPDAGLLPNRFGIDEPEGAPVPVTELDVVLVPCVAVDPTGTRVGFGAGYYDRALAPGVATTRRPTLIGVAFATQQLASIARETWDVPLDVVVTDASVIRPSGSPGQRGRGHGPGAGDDAPAR